MIEPWQLRMLAARVRECGWDPPTIGETVWLGRMRLTDPADPDPAYLRGWRDAFRACRESVAEEIEHLAAEPVLPVA